MIYSPLLNHPPLSLLCHPRTHEPLQIAEGRLFAPHTGDSFPIQGNIPRLIAPQTPFRHRFWAWVYNQIAFAYDWGVAVAWQWKLGGQPIDRHAYLDNIQLNPGELVLETAVGTGANIEFLPTHAEYVGLDISYPMLRRCARRLKKAGRNAYLVQGDAQWLPFFDDTFDAVYHMGGLQFLANPHHALTEALRVTKPGGRIWMIDEAYAFPTLLTQVSERKQGFHARTLSPLQQGTEILEQSLPATAEDIHTELISNGELYLLSYRKRKD